MKTLTPEDLERIVATPYAEMVAQLAKPGADVLSGLTPMGANLIHMAMGIAGEAGELLDAIKKATVYGKPLDLGNVIEELGDLEFYLEGLRAELRIDREVTLEENKIKLLGKRYASGTYSDAQAIERADKAEESQ